MLYAFVFVCLDAGLELSFTQVGNFPSTHGTELVYDPKLSCDKVGVVEALSLSLKLISSR